MKLYAEIDDKDRELKTLYGIVEYMDGTRLVCDKFYAVKEQEPKTDHWIKIETHWGFKYKCPRCSKILTNKWDFCPWCGKSMKVENEEDKSYYQYTKEAAERM